MPWDQRIEIMRNSLPETSLDEHEPKEQSQKCDTTSLSVQTKCYLDLPPEIRNRIYEAALIPEGQAEGLIVATPFRDDAMTLATQSALNQVSRQVRAETLPMFYANNAFVAYIRRFDFSKLIRWVRCITSGPAPPDLTIQVQVKLLDQMRCMFDLLALVRDWHTLEHGTIHLKIHNCYPTPQPKRGFDQRMVVAKAIQIAEDLRAQAGCSEADLQYECCRLIGGGWLLRRLGCNVKSGECLAHTDTWDVPN